MTITNPINYKYYRILLSEFRNEVSTWTKQKIFNFLGKKGRRLKTDLFDQIFVHVCNMVCNT